MKLKIKRLDHHGIVAGVIDDLKLVELIDQYLPQDEKQEITPGEANAEDNCTGRFWEGRYKSQTLLDETALAACMAYVDLNPIRANIAKTPEQSDFTSAQQRIKAAIHNQQPKNLLPFVGNPRQHMPTGLPFELLDYLQLVQLTGKCIREDKPGYIQPNLPNILPV
jgi:hypothetical protein